MMFAFCYRSGEIEFGKSVPDGARPIANGPEKVLRRRIEGCARLAYDNKTLLVPGLPEAQSDEAAIDVVTAFSDRVGQFRGARR